MYCMNCGTHLPDNANFCLHCGIAQRADVVSPIPLKTQMLESHVIMPQEVADLVPILDHTVIKGGYYVPTDTDVRGWYCAAALAEKAIATGGATFDGNVHVTDLQQRKA